MTHKPQINKVSSILAADRYGNMPIQDYLLDFAKKSNADLLMIMTQQENDFTDLFIGSQAQAIINHSEVPVLSIIPRETDVDLSSVLHY